MKNHASRRHLARLTAPLLLVALVAVAATPQARAESPALTAGVPSFIDHIYFGECKHLLANGFLGYWNANDGMNRFGCPVSEEVGLDGMVVQYFQRARFEYHPAADGKAAYVGLTDLGTLVNEARIGDDIVQRDRQRSDYIRAQADTVRAQAQTTLQKIAGVSARAMPLFNGSGEPVSVTKTSLPAAAFTSDALTTSFSVDPSFQKTWEANKTGYGAPLTQPFPFVADGVSYIAQDFERVRLLNNDKTGVITYDLGQTAATLSGITTAPVANTQNYWSWEGLSEHWAEVNLTKETITFMRGPVVVRSAAYIVSGKKDHETPAGTFYINRRVANEHMVNGKPGDVDYYDLKNVLYTQYFTYQGHALHYAYWWSNFGFAGSHGCVNQDLATSKFAWDYLNIGSRVTIHY